jgi:hypothetical protein
MFLWLNDRLFNRYLKVLRKMDMRSIYPIAFKCDFLYREEFSMALVYNVTAGPVVDSDVAERRLSVAVNGEVRSTSPFPANTTSFGELSFSDNDSVVLTLVDVDDAGNVSSPATVQFTAVDTVPPVAPGEFGVAFVREE